MGELQMSQIFWYNAVAMIVALLTAFLTTRFLEQKEWWQTLGIQSLLGFVLVVASSWAMTSIALQDNYPEKVKERLTGAKIQVFSDDPHRVSWIATEESQSGKLIMRGGALNVRTGQSYASFDANYLPFVGESNTAPYDYYGHFNPHVESSGRPHTINKIDGLECRHKDKTIPDGRGEIIVLENISNRLYGNYTSHQTGVKVNFTLIDVDEVRMILSCPDNVSVEELALRFAKGLSCPEGPLTFDKAVY